MKILLVFLILQAGIIYSQNAWINEFHYDNTGTPDIGEFVEVAIEDANNYDLSDFRISFYSSTSGLRYGIYHDLSTFDVGVEDNNITLYSKMISGIQNGPNDGIALDYGGTVLQFISYEGTLTGSEGVADGITSEDIGVEENNSTPAGYSVGFTGSGTNPSIFTWSVLSDDTPGKVNLDQVLPVEMTTFSASVDGSTIRLYWETATEVNNYGFEVERQNLEINGQRSEWEKIGFIEGHGNSHSHKYYSFTDNTQNVNGKIYYRLKQIDLDGKFEYSNIVEVESRVPGNIKLLQNYPNPFNPTTTIRFHLPFDCWVKLSVLNVLGEEIVTLIERAMSSGYHSIEFDAGNINSGIYFYKLETADFNQLRKMTLIK